MVTAIAVQTTAIGKSPAVEGIVLIVNPGTATELILSFPPDLAIASGGNLQKHGSSYPEVIGDEIVIRDRPEKLDS